MTIPELTVLTTGENELHDATIAITDLERILHLIIALPKTFDDPNHVKMDAVHVDYKKLRAIWSK